MQRVRVIPLGGLGEIGKNMSVFEYGNNAIIVDAGLMFPEGDHLGIDYIIPDMGYLVEHRARLNIHGIFVTHGHEDHTGAIRHVLDVVDAPIFATALTCGLLNNKIKEARINHANLVTIKAGDTIKRGPFEVEAFHVCHSIPDCVGFAIRTPVGLMVHTGDFKFDHTPVDGWPTDFARISSYGQQGVLALFSDSTNADRPGWTPSETVIDAAFDRVFSRAEGRIIVATFASLISRIAQVATACTRYGRKMAVAGTSMQENIKMALELKYLDFPRELIVPLDQALRMAPEKVVFMVTGSQGEPSAVLSRLANHRHNQIEIEPGDTVIMSAHPIPGNEEMVQRIINKMIQSGADVVYDAIESVHVSGHASQEEMKLMLNLVRPKYFVPVHGELRHLHSHSRLAIEQGIPKENCAIIENGTILEFDKDRMYIGERYPGGYVFVDGHGVGDIGPAVMRDREILASEGFVVVIANVGKNGELYGDPRIISRGFVFLRDSEGLFNNIKETVRKTLKKGMNGRREELVEEAVTRMVLQETKRRPMVFAHIHKVAD
jgi:ribonuclease J